MYNTEDLRCQAPLGSTGVLACALSLPDHPAEGGRRSNPCGWEGLLSQLALFQSSGTCLKRRVPGDKGNDYGYQPGDQDGQHEEIVSGAVSAEQGWVVVSLYTIIFVHF